MTSDNEACYSVFAGTGVSNGVGENKLEANTISRDIENNQPADGSLLGAEEEKSKVEVSLSADDQRSKSLNHVNQNVTSDVVQVESNVRQIVEGQLGGTSEEVGSHGRQEMEAEEFNNTDHHKSTDEKVIKHVAMKPGSSGRCYQANYLLPPEKEGEFSVSDMVWGKVRSHPWWPGQIFDPSDSSEKAMKHYKKDCFLVAYFGDRTFAWNEASQLKPFRAHFPNIEKQSNSESFQNAVDCALDEVSRRVEFGLACSCIPKDTYDEIKFQTVENTGIREETSLRHGVDESLNAGSFSPDKLIEYLKILSQCPTSGFSRLELVIAKAQLLAFYRLKGYSYLPELQHCGGLDNDMDSSIQDSANNLSEDVQHANPVISKNADQASAGHRVSKGPNSSYHKRKHNLKDGMYPKKEKSLSELIVGTPDSPDDYWSEEKAIDSLVSPTISKKRRTIDPYADDSGMQDGRKTISPAKVFSSAKQSFKIGDCIRRVASKLTGSPTLKGSGDKSQKPDESNDVFDGDVSNVSVQNLEEAQRSSLIVPTEYSSLDDLLSSLQRVAQDPLENCNFLSVIVSFFSDFRNSIVVGNYSGREITPTNKVGAKRKKQPVAGSPETFEFEDMSDTYWTDRVIQNGSEEQPSKRSRKRDNQSVPTDPEKPVQVSRRTYTRKRITDSNQAEASHKPAGYIDKNSPAELVMNFAELDSVPSETNLNKMFRRFGPLKESETEVDTVSSRARVVFKKCADAEVAFNSAKKFSIFGPILVNYQLNYTPSALFKASTVAATHDQEMHLDLSNFEVNMV